MSRAQRAQSTAHRVRRAAALKNKFDLVEDEIGELGHPLVRVEAVHEQQRVEHAKASDAVIGGVCCCSSLHAGNTHANVSGENHLATKGKTNCFGHGIYASYAAIFSPLLCSYTSIALGHTYKFRSCSKSLYFVCPGRRRTAIASSNKLKPRAYRCLFNSVI